MQYTIITSVQMRNLFYTNLIAISISGLFRLFDYNKNIYNIQID